MNCDTTKKRCETGTGGLSPFYLEDFGGLHEYTDKRFKENGHMVIVIAEGVRQELLSESMLSVNKQDASGNKLLQDAGLWISD